MTITTLLLFLFSPLSLRATSLTLEDCLDQAEMRGKHHTLNEGKVSPSCAAKIKNKSKLKASKISPLALYQAYAHKNLLFVEELFKTKRLLNFSGDQSGLNEVHAVAIDDLNKSVVVLANSPKQILTYVILNGGNRSPNFTFNNNDFEKAQDIAISSPTDELIVLFENQIHFYKRQANSLIKNNPQFDTSLKRKIDLLSPIEGSALAISNQKQQLFVYDKSSQEVIVIKINDGHIVKKLSLKQPPQGKVVLDYDDVDQELHLRDDSGYHEKLATP
jgi:hypothetical protein